MICSWGRCLSMCMHAREHVRFLVGPYYELVGKSESVRPFLGLLKVPKVPRIEQRCRNVPQIWGL